MDHAPLEAVADRIRALAGLDAGAVERPSRIARLAGVEVWLADWDREMGRLERQPTGPVILVARRLPRPLCEWVVGHELAHWARGTGCSRGHRTAEERACDYIGAAIQMPRGPFADAWRQRPDRYEEIAALFGAHAPAAALRVGEVASVAIAVDTGRWVYQRGDWGGKRPESVPHVVFPLATGRVLRRAA